MTVGSQVKQCLATIKQIEASLEQLSVKTANKQAEQAYKDAAEIVNNTKKSLQSQVAFLHIEEPQYKQ